MKVPRMGEKAFEQSAGFLRIPDGKNPLDNSCLLYTSPESIERCKIHYLSAIEAKNAVMDFLRLIEQYEPKAVGGRLPDAGFIPEKQ